MRIIAGKYKGRKIEMPKGVEIRPTQDRVREAVFNIIRTEVEAARVLDLFAGSGAYGIEGMSRGASSCLFVDGSQRCALAIKKNLERLGLTEGVRVWKSDCLKAVRKMSGRERFDMIFLDPPYYRGLAKKTLIYINDYDILMQPGFVIAEHHKKDGIAEDLSRIELFTQRTYGDTIISLFRHRGTA